MKQWSTKGLMRNIILFLFEAIVSVIIVSCGVTRSLSSKDCINPIDYGILQAKTGIERYLILYNCHTSAVKSGKNVSYKGIKHLFLEIPPNAEPIPLTTITDFGGVTIEVLNNAKGVYLFQLTRTLDPVEVSGRYIDRGDYTQAPELSQGNYLLVIKDETPWVDNRIGYNYGAERRDVIKIHNGMGNVGVVQSYQTPSSLPRCTYCPLNGKQIVFENLVFIRNEESSKVTCLVKIENQADVVISNVTIKTPNVGNLFGDTAISVENVAGLTIERVNIEGSYSQTNKYGYGVYLNNVSELRVVEMWGHANWGVFGNYNINRAFIEKSDINRFDIHCYGRDILFKRCKFSGLYNQFSSVYGKVSFDNCEFTDFTPVLIEPSFNAYTPFDLEWRNCVFNLDITHNCLLSLGGLTELRNTRQELARKCVPNITIKNCIVNVTDELNEWSIVNTGPVKYTSSLDNISKIEISGLKLNGNQSRFHFFSEELVTTNKLKIKTKGIKASDGK